MLPGRIEHDEAQRIPEGKEFHRMRRRSAVRGEVQYRFIVFFAFLIYVDSSNRKGGEHGLDGLPLAPEY
jgi:hypothetical protein